MALMDDIKGFTPVKCLLIGCGLLAGYKFTIYDQGLAQQAEITSLQDDMEKKRQSMAEVNKAMADKEAFQKEADLIAREYERLTAYMPAELDINAFQKDLSVKLQASGNRLQSMKNEVLTARFPGFFEQGMNVQSLGSFHAIMEFMSEVTKMNRIVDFTTMGFDALPASEGASQIQFKTVMSVFSKAPAASADDKKKEPGK